MPDTSGGWNTTNNTPYYSSFSSMSSLCREMLVSKGIGKRGVEVIAVEMLVFMFLV